MIKAVFFDVANTLLGKPEVFIKIQHVLQEEGFDIPVEELTQKHAWLSEVIDFPDKTSAEFYRNFNSKLLLQFGIIPSDDLLARIFEACTYLPWIPFPDTQILNHIIQPVGVISNWDHSLRNKLAENFDTGFKWILGSAETQNRKPSLEFYKRVLDFTGLIPEEILYAGDSLKLDIVPALSVGLKAILVDRLNLYPHSKTDRVSSLDELINYL